MKQTSPILQMLYGERGKIDAIKPTAEQRAAISKVTVTDAALRKALNPEQIKLYEDALDSLENLHSISVSNCYAEGFRFGVLIGIDVTTEQ